MYSAKITDRSLNITYLFLKKVVFCKWDLDKDFDLCLPIPIQIRMIMAGCYRLQVSVERAGGKVLSPFIVSLPLHLSLPLTHLPYSHVGRFSKKARD